MLQNITTILITNTYGDQNYFMYKNEELTRYYLKSINEFNMQHFGPLISTLFPQIKVYKLIKAKKGCRVYFR